jgi:hypothetical protein
VGTKGVDGDLWHVVYVKHPARLDNFDPHCPPQRVWHLPNRALSYRRLSVLFPALAVRGVGVRVRTHPIHRNINQLYKALRIVQIDHFDGTALSFGFITGNR